MKNAKNGSSIAVCILMNIIDQRWKIYGTRA